MNSRGRSHPSWTVSGSPSPCAPSLTRPLDAVNVRQPAWLHSMDRVTAARGAFPTWTARPTASA